MFCVGLVMLTVVYMQGYLCCTSVWQLIVLFFVPALGGAPPLNIGASVGQVRWQSVFVGVLQSCFCQCFSDVCVHVCIKTCVQDKCFSLSDVSVVFQMCIYISICVYMHIYVCKCMYKRTFLLVKWLVSQFILSSVTCTKNECLY